ncbi:MAG: ABC transporter ATP-binding protein, partial [Planctomycetota bacterium]
MSAAVEVEGLVKKYGDLTAVAGIDLLVEKGTCLGLLGPNGAGKTTTIEILEGLLPRDGGKVRILGRCWEKEPQQIRLRIGVQLQATRFPDKLTVRETIRTFRALYPEGRDPDELLDLVGLAGKANSRVVQLSGGQHQRLALGCALVGAPELLFLDEPTTGLDPQARRRVWDIVESFKKNGGSVLLTTHYMDEAERLCDQLLIVDEGKVIAKGPPQEIISSLGADGIVEFKPEDDSLVDIAALE